MGHFFVTGCNSGNDFALLKLAEEADPLYANHICLPHRVNHAAGGNNETDSLLSDIDHESTKIDWVEVAKPISIYGWGSDRNTYSHSFLLHTKSQPLQR